ncbi:MAG: cell division protein ZipA C-terminal FtsZ-binding domain-containing protein, partial [Gammaproteobacteria bacterium]|nr:cell division protein ZipA C-terminal FtsZ-binding domain-containing protein [Gammaproteobacteria bacterium]
MSDLQLGLLMLGALIVIAVVGFNWWQERQFRGRAEASFPEQHDDILLNRPQADPVRAPAPAEPTARGEDTDTRIEPRIEPLIETPQAASQWTGGDSGDREYGIRGSGNRDSGNRDNGNAAAEEQAGIDYVAEIRAGEFVAPAQLAAFRQLLGALGPKIAVTGMDYQSRSWQPLSIDSGRYTSIRAALQLVDRSGQVKAEQMQAFADAVRASAQQMAAIADLPDFAPYLDLAAELDTFCADVDVVVGINVVANSGQVFHGTKIRALAEASGLHLQSGGMFHLRDEHGRALFTLENQEPAPFQTDLIRNLTTPGITFLLDVPRTADGLKVFDRMVAMSRSFAESLDGTLADDNRALLNDSGLDKIRAQLRAIYTAMARRGIPAGSPV